MTMADDEPPITQEEEDSALAAQGEPPPRARPRLAIAPAKVNLYDIAAEEALIAAALLSRTACDTLAAVPTSAWGDPGLGIIAAAINHLHGEGQPVDIVTVADHLHRHDTLEVAGGRPRLLGLNAPSTSNAAHYARIIKGLHRLRELRHVALTIEDAATTPGADPATIADQAQVALDALEGGGDDHHVVAIAPALEDWLDNLTARTEGAQEVIRTGWTDLDAIIGGLHPGSLTTIAGRPGLGKSDVAVSLAHRAAIGVPTLVVSVEMGRDEIIDRWIAAQARVPATTIRSANLAERDWDRITPAIGALSHTHLFIDDDPAASIASIRAAARRVDAGLIVVDYLQLIHTPRAESRQLEVTHIASGLKRMARQLEVPVVALAQLNRGVESRLDKRPMLSDLRESGSIEQESDLVIGLYRDDYYHRDSTDGGVLEMVVLKNRHGATGTARLAYDPARKTIFNIAPGG